MRPPIRGGAAGERAALGAGIGVEGTVAERSMVNTLEGKQNKD